jgi:small subunit ribosomal protein S8
MNNYPVGDYLIRIKNAARAGRREAVVQNSKFIQKVAEALKKMQVLQAIETKDGMLISTLSYHKKEPMLIDLKLVSKPGLRKYITYEDMGTRKRRNSTELVLSTSHGVMSSSEAGKKRLGGEVIAEVW